MLPDRFHRCTDGEGANRVVRRTIDPGEARPLRVRYFCSLPCQRQGEIDPDQVVDAEGNPATLY